MQEYNLCIIKPNASSFSETFIQEHINRLGGNKKVLCGGSFPVYDHEGSYLIKSKLGLLSYLFQKRILKKEKIGVRDRALVNYLIKKKINIVFAEYGTVGAMVNRACKTAGIPLVIHFHGADAHHKPTVKKYLELYQEAFNYASAIITVSLDMSGALKKLGAPGDKVVCIPCGVNTELFPEIDISGSGPNFVSVGRFVEKKSPLTVIEAFKIVSDKMPDAHLWMVGKGPLFTEAKSLINSLKLTNKITLTGVLSSGEIAVLFKQMRCFVQHSVTASDGDMEGTPVTILEASSSALPVISTKHAGIKEAVIDGVTGFLVGEHDVRGMSERMLEIGGPVQKAKQMGHAGRKHIIENYSVQQEIDRLNEVIRKCVVK